VNFLYDIVHEEQKARGLKDTAYIWFQSPSTPKSAIPINYGYDWGPGRHFWSYMFIF